MKKRRPIKTNKEPLFDRDRIHRLLVGAVLGLKSHRTFQLGKLPEFRVSGLPFCAMLFAGSTMEREVTYTSDFYFLVGHAIHELIQKHIDHEPLKKDVEKIELWGDWEHGPTGSRRSNCTRPKMFNPIDWTYKEVNIEYRGLHGHVDAILLLKYKTKPPQFIVLDYKTTMFFGGNKVYSKYPSPPNVHQVTAYAAILREKYGFNIVGHCLMYIDRTKPVTSFKDIHICLEPWTEKDQVRRIASLNRDCESHVYAEKLLQDRVTEKPALTSEERAEALKTIVATRHCQSERDYDDHMSAAFYHNDGKKCSHLSMCASGCSTKKLVKYFDEVLSSPMDLSLSLKSRTPKTKG